MARLERETRSASWCQPGRLGYRVWIIGALTLSGGGHTLRHVSADVGPASLAPAGLHSTASPATGYGRYRLSSCLDGNLRDSAAEVTMKARLLAVMAMVPLLIQNGTAQQPAA